MNIALPSAQEDLGFSNDSRQWIVTAYALAFGSLLLLGGRLGDLFGRKWTFIGGLLGFSVASAIGGAAELVRACSSRARALQGVFGALLAPSALGAARARRSPTRPSAAKAFGIFGAIAGGGAAVGLLLGGILTEVLSWRWCLYVNLLFAIPTAIAAFSCSSTRPRQNRPQPGPPGHAAPRASACSRSSTGSRTPRRTRGAHPVTIIMLAARRRAAERVRRSSSRASRTRCCRCAWSADRTRGGSYLAIGISGIAMFAVFLFLTYYLQQTKGFTPIQTGLAFLPMTGGDHRSRPTSVNIRFLAKVGPRPLLVARHVPRRGRDGLARADHARLELRRPRAARR